MNRNDHMKVLYRQSEFPIFQNRMYDTQKDACACPKGNIQLVEDQHTGLVYNAEFNPELMNYDTDYQNEQAHSPLFREHLESVTSIIYRCIGQNFLVEVGCGKGFFLEMLLEKDFDITGYDPAYEGINPKIKKAYFSSDINTKANGLVLRHVLEHIQNPFEFLLHLKEANGGQGLILIEVPCFEWICKHQAWYDIFYEHVNYFRISDFFRMFGKIVESGHLFGGQYLYVVADLATIRQPKIDHADTVNFPKNFTESINTKNMIKQANKNSNEIAIWGGASKGVIFALLMIRAGKLINSVIDINPAKQNKFIPASGLMIKSPHNALASLPVASTIYIMNSNYSGEIKKMGGKKFNYIEIDKISPSLT